MTIAPQSAHRNRGFTIIETVLAVVVGGLVLMGCVSVFLAANRAERAFSARRPPPAPA